MQKRLVEDRRKHCGSNEVLMGVLVAAHGGDATCIIGSRGSGNSTLLRCINLLEQPKPGRMTLTVQRVPDRNVTRHPADPKPLQRLRRFHSGDLKRF